MSLHLNYIVMWISLLFGIEGLFFTLFWCKHVLEIEGHVYGIKIECIYVEELSPHCNFRHWHVFSVFVLRLFSYCVQMWELERIYEYMNFSKNKIVISETLAQKLCQGCVLCSLGGGMVAWIRCLKQRVWFSPPFPGYIFLWSLGETAPFKSTSIKVTSYQGSPLHD